MRITQHIAARTFVWLAAVAIPLQGLPAFTCGCDSVATCSHKTETVPSCCSTGKTNSGCCSKNKTTASCCSKDKSSGSCCSSDEAKTTGKGGCLCEGSCTCGANCQCGKDSVPAEPTAPPVENSSPKRVVADSAAAASIAAIYQPSSTGRHPNVCTGATALSALDRCATLCRFTI